MTRIQIFFVSQQLLGIQRIPSIAIKIKKLSHNKLFKFKIYSPLLRCTARGPDPWYYLGGPTKVGAWRSWEISCLIALSVNYNNLLLITQRLSKVLLLLVFFTLKWCNTTFHYKTHFFQLQSLFSPIIWIL